MNKSVELWPTDQERARVETDVKENIGDRFIVVHLRNWFWQAKNISMDVWFDIFAKLFEARTDFKIVTVGGSSDHSVDHPLFVDRRDQYNCHELKVLCDHAACFVGIDSAPYWSAAASETAIIALMTHLTDKNILPYRYNDIAWNAIGISTKESCHGCNQRQQRPVRQLVCEKSTYPCVSNFDTREVADKILRVLLY
jgi:ADP-heptose:LPS heptosyltransferase